MAFTINTNIASLQAQNYLSTDQAFQNKTINRVTSGLRIVNSGDDAAGLAIANGIRSDISVIGQGVRNANDGLSTLQTIDGGINNISQLLDRARTLAAQSASGTFTGDRSVLNNEFQNVLGEVDRQAQAIGLNTGGTFATNLSVFIGGGRGATAGSTITNGSVGIDLSQSTVDTRSLGLKGLQATGADATAVNDIINNTTNTASEVTSGSTDFYFRGAGFADTNRVRVSVNLSGVNNLQQLVTAINGGITQAGSAGTGVSTAFKNAGIQATISTDASGNQKLAFVSGTSAFQVSAGDRLSNALLGNSTGNAGTALDYAVSGAATAASTGTTFAATRDIYVRIQGGSTSSPVDLHLSVTASTTVDQAISSLTSLVASNASLVSAGITVSQAAAGQALTFTSKRGENFTVSDVNDTGNLLGLGTAQNTGGTSAAGFDVTSITGATFAAGTAGGATTLGFSVGGGNYVTVSQTIATDSTAATVVASLNTAFASDNNLQQAGLVAATVSGGAISISSNNGTYFRVNVNSDAAAADLGFGTSAGATTTTSVGGSSNTASAALVAGGASTSGLLAYSPIQTGNDPQVITVAAKDAAGTQQSLAITLRADSTAGHGRTIDEAIDYINSQLQSSGNSTLRSIVAVKTRDSSAGGAEKIQFVSPLSNFTVSVGANPGASGITTSQGSVVNSSLIAGGNNLDVSSQADAENAVSSLASATSLLGSAQAVVGRGQNQFNYAVSLAQTQLTNLSASQSQIRDADLASEAANLTKAQILEQAGIAALAQANSAPQAILALLK